MTMVEELLRLYRLTADDLQRVRLHGRIVVPRLDRFIEQFYDWMRTQPLFASILANHPLGRGMHVSVLQDRKRRRIAADG